MDRHNEDTKSFFLQSFVLAVILYLVSEAVAAIDEREEKDSLDNMTNGCPFSPTVMAKILCLFDELCALERLSDELSGAHMLHFASDADDAISMLELITYDIFLCDAFLRTQNVERVLLRLKPSGVLRRTPVFCIRACMTPLAISCDVLLSKTTMALGAAAYMSLDKFIRCQDEILASCSAI